MSEKLTGYDLSRQWFEMIWENPELTANHTSLYFWLCEIWNRLGKPERFQITSSECMAGMLVKTYKTYKKCFDDLIKMGCINLLKQSTNQYQCNVIALVKFDKAPTKALSKARVKAQSKSKPIFIKPINPEPLTNKTYADCIGLYNSFCLKKLNVSAKIDGAQGNAMKSIIAYLSSIPKIKEGAHTVQESLSFVFDNWDKVDSFYQTKIKLTDINSNFINILNSIRNPSKNGIHKQPLTGDDLTQAIRDDLKRNKY